MQQNKGAHNCGSTTTHHTKSPPSPPPTSSATGPHHSNVRPASGDSGLGTLICPLCLARCGHAPDVLNSAIPARDPYGGSVPDADIDGEPSDDGDEYEVMEDTVVVESAMADDAAGTSAGGGDLAPAARSMHAGHYAGGGTILQELRLHNVGKTLAEKGKDGVEVMGLQRKFGWRSKSPMPDSTLPLIDHNVRLIRPATGPQTTTNELRQTGTRAPVPPVGQGVGVASDSSGAVSVSACRMRSGSARPAACADAACSSGGAPATSSCAASAPRRGATLGSGKTKTPWARRNSCFQSHSTHMRRWGNPNYRRDCARPGWVTGAWWCGGVGWGGVFVWGTIHPRLPRLRVTSPNHYLSD